MICTNQDDDSQKSFGFQQHAEVNGQGTHFVLPSHHLSRQTVADVSLVKLLCVNT